MLKGKVAARWYQVGVVLGTPIRELETIRMNKDGSARSRELMMLQSFLENGGESATWQRLVDAVGHEAGGDYRGLALQLSKGMVYYILSYN